MSETDEPSDADAGQTTSETDERSLLERAAKRFGLPGRVVVALLGLAPLPQLFFGFSGRVIGLSELGLIMFVLAAHVARPGKAKVRRCLLTTAFSLPGVAAVALVFLFALSTGSGRHGILKSANTRATAALIRTATGPGMVGEVHAFGRWFALRRNGEIFVFDNGAHLLFTFRVSGPAQSLVACRQWLFVTHGDGRVAKLAPRTGVVRGDYRYDDQPGELGDLACWHTELWASKPSQGGLVELSPRTLTDLYGDPITSYATSIASGWINGTSGIWVLDGPESQLVGIAWIDGQLEKVGPFPVGQGATQILYAGTSMWILHAKPPCLNEFDSNSDSEDHPGLPVGLADSGMSASNGDIYVAGGAQVTIVDTSEAATSAEVLSVGDDKSRLVAANEYGGMLVATDALGAVFGASPTAQQAHQLHQPRSARSACQ